MIIMPITPPKIAELLESGKLTQGKYITIFQNKNYRIEINLSGKSGWIIGEYRGRYPIGDNFIRYSDGSIAYDNPGKIPEYIKKIINRFMYSLCEA